MKNRGMVEMKVVQFSRICTYPILKSISFTDFHLFFKILFEKKIL